MTAGRIVIIPFLHGKRAPDGTVVEPDIDAILKKWLERHPEFQGTDFHVGEIGDGEACMAWVSADSSPDHPDYDPPQDADLYKEFLAKKDASSSPKCEKIWTEQCEAAKGIEDDFGTQKAQGDCAILGKMA